MQAFQLNPRCACWELLSWGLLGLQMLSIGTVITDAQRRAQRGFWLASSDLLGNSS